MLLSGVLFVLFLTGWLYCLTDAALTPAEVFTGWRKRTWIVVIALTLVAGAIAWMIARRGRDRSGWTVPRGPDDDPEFIRQLAQRIHGSPTDPAE